MTAERKHPLRESGFARDMRGVVCRVIGPVEGHPQLWRVWYAGDDKEKIVAAGFLESVPSEFAT